MPVFWKHGFADASLQELERATGVNKSGLYTEFRDKEDLFVACLRHYLESQGKRGLLTKEPLGWRNVETFLKHGPLNKKEQQGCFSINSMRAVEPHFCPWSICRVDRVARTTQAVRHRVGYQPALARLLVRLRAPTHYTRLIFSALERMESRVHSVTS